jgi:hypothetical protein
LRKKTIRVLIGGSGWEITSPLQQALDLLAQQPDDHQAADALVHAHHHH